MSAQGQTVAEIALSLTDKPTPTAMEILVALNKAFEAGYREGKYHGQMQELNRHLTKEMLGNPIADAYAKGYQNKP